MATLENTPEAKDFRKMQASQLQMSCPKCFTLMKYRQEPDFEGWFCESCNRGTPIGTNEDMIKNMKKEEKPMPTKEELVKKADRFKKG